MQNWQVRVAPSLGGGFAGTPEEVWGVKPYENDTDPTVFFGLYGLPDFYTLWRHKGDKAVLWAGSDIRHLLCGYWLDGVGKLRLPPWDMAAWIDINCDNYVENNVEQQALAEIGIKANVVPSFLGSVDEYDLVFKPTDPPKLYTSVSGDDFELYGWNKIDGLAKANPDIEFHLYGNKSEWKSNQKNVFVHGRVSHEQMNDEIKCMTGALRLTEFDGFSEILAKSLLWGQWPVSTIPYPFVMRVDEIGAVKFKKEPNIEGRKYYLNEVNKYPWNVKNN